MYKLLIETPPAYVDNVTVSFDIFKIRIFKVIFYSNGLFRSFINEAQPHLNLNLILISLNLHSEVLFNDE